MSEWDSLICGDEPSCLASPKVYMVIDCPSCRSFAACSREIERRYPGIHERITYKQAFREMLGKARESVQRSLRRNREQDALVAEQRAELRQQALRGLPPARPCLTEAERKRAWRDARQRVKADAYPRLDDGAMNTATTQRHLALSEALRCRPLSPKLRHLVGRERELALAWRAWEEGQVPEGERRPGRPNPVSRAAWCFDVLSGLEPGSTTPAAMRRKIKVVEALEETVWRDCIPGMSSNPVEKVSQGATFI
ncbi:hypothetical protein [Magnetospirillum aberrantis]|uniref:Uncharacterized protein n=1 Tax=Magnetospirillum aberrantis SpK TaxID=908842 RepID=A0A7C9UW30_9PROT|nr:hypothetical protein [Magnetospirillum aberrantis]NFV81406.1 hypothetical protein [Magnetospirillum aberrantis SpK]